MRLTPIALAIALAAGSTSADVLTPADTLLIDAYSVQHKLQRLYTPERQRGEDTFIVHSGDVPFAGDCDDYATAAYVQMAARGHDPRLVVVINKHDSVQPSHVVTCVAETVCLDNQNAAPIPYAKLGRLYGKVRATYVILDAGGAQRVGGTDAYADQ